MNHILSASAGLANLKRLPCLALLRDAAEAMRLSARGYHRVLRVARTLADLDGEEPVRRVHFAEALAYRALADEIRRAA
jgi:magnesium chelatase family protein